MNKQETRFWDSVNGWEFNKFIRTLIKDGYHIDIITPTFYCNGRMNSACVVITKNN